MKDVISRSGYDLAVKILESHPNDAIETLLKYSNGAECDWLEFKAGMMLLPEDVAKGNKPDDLYWDYLLSIVAMANTRGGAFVIGVNDKTHEAVPLGSCDPRHVIEKEGKESYLRKEVLDRFDRPERKWTTKDRVIWSLPTSIVPFLDKRIMPYRGTDVIVLLVSPRKIGEELFVISKSSLGEFEHLPIRDMGEVGHVKRLTKDREFAVHRAYRGEQLLTSQLGTWWAELDVEQQASKADEILDNAIRAYHAKLEEETRKKLRAFIPLEVKGDEADEEDEEEFENPQAISVFDDDDDAWLNSNNKDGDTSDKGSKGSEVEDEAGDLDDDGKETSKRTIKIGLYELLEQRNRVVLVGEPGAGKTTCLAHFAVQQGKKERPRPHLFAFIALGRWVDGGSVRGLVEKTCGISQTQIDTLLAEKRLHLILDALNECPDRFRPGAIENIRILLQDHPDLPVVLSSRKVEGIRLSGVPVFEVQSMDVEQQRLFLERYLHDADAANKILDSLLKQPGGASIAQNPMLLRMVVDVVRANGELPNGRASLYRRWLENWYAREENKAKKAKDVLPWSKEKSIRLLSQMAFAGRAEGYRDIPLDMARHSLGDKDEIFRDRLCQGPLLEIEEGFVHFRHETIQEYLCAEWLLAEPTALNVLPEKDYDTWGMPIAYAAELRLPNKLPDEMSVAVWEMNPWLAALVASSPLRKKESVKGDVPCAMLADAIFRKVNLLSDGLRELFSKEINDGSLFQQADVPVSYVVLSSEDSRKNWELFECAYVLNMPEEGFGEEFGNELRRLLKDHLRNSHFEKLWYKYIRKCRTKILNMLTISRETVALQIKRNFPDVSFRHIVRRSYLFLPDKSVLQYRKSDLIGSVQRQRIKSELRNVYWEMVVSRKSKSQLWFTHPAFAEDVLFKTRGTQYEKSFAVGQRWGCVVCVEQKKDATFRFSVSRVEPLEGDSDSLSRTSCARCNPDSQQQGTKKKFVTPSKSVTTAFSPVAASNDSGVSPLEKPIVTSDKVRAVEIVTNRQDVSRRSHISIYIDETWPGAQDHAYENIGVIGGVVVPWEGVDEKRLPVIKTHLDNGSAARNAIQTMLRRSTVFPFVFPIKWDHAVGAGGRQYFELVQHALMLLMGWMLPQRGQPTTVDVFLEHISGYMDGHDETDFINSLTQAMRLLSGGRRFANWQIRRVEWVDKEFGYVPYGDLVCKTCVPREEQQLLAREVKVREWEGFLPFSKDVFPLLRDMDTTSPSGLADLLIFFAKVADDTPFFRRVRKLAIDRAKADEAVCTALISRFEECYARPDRDMALLNRVVPHFLDEFPPDLFKDRPRLQLLRILIGFQHANHNGDPDLATALVGRYHSLRPRILELDRDLCAYSDLNLAVHHHDSFEFDKALSLVDGWINDPLFPALSVMNRGRMYSSRGQSFALLGRNQEADEAFARALSIFSAEPELLVLDIAQTKTYQAMNALDHDASSAVPLVEGLLGKSLIATALNLTALLERPFAAHLFLKTLWRMRDGRSVVQDALIKNLPTDIAFRKQHPYELILFYLALLTKEANPSYAKACVREMEQFFEAIEFGGTLGLIHAYMRVMLKRHGLNVATEKDFFEELDIVEQYLTKAGTIINEFRMRWGNPSMSIDGILPFNYC